MFKVNNPDTGSHSHTPILTHIHDSDTDSEDETNRADQIVRVAVIHPFTGRFHEIAIGANSSVAQILDKP